MLNIEEIKQLIVEKLKPLNPYQIILFGSYAYGTPTKDSDLDICIIDKGEISKRERKSKIRKALKEIKIAKSLLDVLDIETISLKTGLTIEEIILLK